MNNDILTDNTVVYYVVRVDGENVTAPLTSAQLAEMERMKLPQEKQIIAEIVPVTSEGKQLLFEGGL